MKKTLLFCAFICLLSFTVQAQDNSEFKKETIEFIKLTGSGAAFESAIDQIGMMVSETNKGEYVKEASKTLDAVYEKLAEVYMQEFTHEEIKELVMFYNTTLGKKLAEKQLTLTQKAMMIGQNWGMEVQALAQKYN